MAILALLVLVVSIVIGTKFKINIGIMGIVGACILALIAGISVRDLVGGFNSTLFLRLLGIQLLVCAAQNNGTMETLAKKLVSIVSKRSVRFIPIVIFVVFSVAGLAGVDVVFLATPFVLALAYQMNMNPIKMLLALILAFQGSAISPLALSGINLYSVAEQSGIAVNGWNNVTATMISSSIIFIVYFFVSGWYKEEAVVLEGVGDVKFNWKHVVTLLGFAAYVIMTMGFGIDTLIAPTLIAFVLLMIGASDSRKTIASIPWNILIMIGGMSLLTGVVSLLGGVELLSNVIAKVTNPFILTPIMLLVAGCMSFFASGNGVVIPTLVPVVANLSGNASSLVTAVGLGAGCTGVSPFSTIGGHMMSCYDSIYHPTDEERTKTFNQLLITSLICIGSNAIISLTGILGVNLF